jgi:outer membrane protein assembly factor BamB
MTYRSGSSAAPVIVGFGGKVFALDPETGRRIWAWDGGTSSAVRLCVEEGRVYVLARTCLACVEAARGSLIWQLTIPIADTLLVSGDRIFVGGAGEVRCYSGDGALLWEDEFKGMGLGAVALAVEGRSSQADLWG